MPLHHHLLLLLFPSFFFITAISANVSDYCLKTRCGNLIVEYPFYLTSTSSSICGYDGFGINCSTGRPIISLPSDVYLVKNISYDSKKLTLVDTEIYSEPCPLPRHNVTLNSNSTLKLDGVNTNYTFLIDCTKGPPSSSNSYPSPTSSQFVLPPINCLGNQSFRSYFLLPNQASLSAQWLSVCNRSVVVPFLGNYISKPNGSFPMVVKNGFILDWSQAALCSGCEASKGCCGRNTATQQFVCFCNDGPHSNNCNDR